MWRRNMPEKHPTPITQPPEAPSEQKPMVTGLSFESDVEEEVK